MTKIIINIDGKVYKTTRSKAYIYTQIMEWIDKGFLELQPQEEKRDETEGKKLSDEMKRVGFGYEQSDYFYQWCAEQLGYNS